MKGEEIYLFRAVREGPPRGYLLSLGHSGERGSNDRSLLSAECQWGQKILCGGWGQRTGGGGFRSCFLAVIEEFELNVALSAREAIGEF